LLRERTPRFWQGSKGEEERRARVLRKDWGFFARGKGIGG